MEIGKQLNVYHCFQLKRKIRLGPTGFNEFKGDPGKATHSALSEDKEIAKKLWEVSESLVGYNYL